MQTHQSTVASSTYTKESFQANSSKTTTCEQSGSFNEIFEVSKSAFAIPVIDICTGVINAHYEEHGHIESIKDGVKTSEDYHVSVDYELLPIFCIEGVFVRHAYGVVPVAVAVVSEESFGATTQKHGDRGGQSMLTAFMASFDEIAHNHAQMNASISSVREEYFREQNKQVTESAKKSSCENMTEGLKSILQKTQFDSIFGLSGAKAS